VRNRRRCLRWVFDANKRFGLSMIIAACLEVGVTRLCRQEVSLQARGVRLWLFGILSWSFSSSFLSETNESEDSGRA